MTKRPKVDSIIRWGVFLAILASASCGGSTSELNTIEIINWWRKGGEAPALRQLITLFNQKHPNQNVINQPLAGSAEARAKIKERILGGEPPETFQANGGWDLLSWVLYNNLDESESKMALLDDFANWASAIPDPVLDTVRVGSHIYAVPLNIHRINTLFFNNKVFRDKGLEPPTRGTLTSLDDLFALIETLQQKGLKTPIALGTKDPWVLSLLLFENLLVARAGGTAYRNFFLGTGDVLTSEPIKKSVDDLWRLLSYDPTANTRLWDKAADLVANGTAAMTIMGDWTKGYFLDKAKVDQAEIDFGEIPMPGPEGTFVFTTDTFGLPAAVRNPDGAIQLLQLFGSQEGQDTFNPIKGSIPARRDATVGKYDPLGQQTIVDFQRVAEDRTKLVPATAILAPPEYMAAVNDMLFNFAGNPDQPLLKGNVSVVLHGLQNWSDVLRGSAWH